MQRYHDDCAKTSEYTRLGFETAMEVIKSLPSEVPSDLISRKAILEWIQQSLSEYGNTYSTDMLNMWGLFEEQIKTFPPVEGVKIMKEKKKTCEECKYYEHFDKKEFPCIDCMLDCKDRFEPKEGES